MYVYIYIYICSCVYNRAWVLSNSRLQMESSGRSSEIGGLAPGRPEQSGEASFQPRLMFPGRVPKVELGDPGTRVPGALNRERTKGVVIEEVVRPVSELRFWISEG